jgi:hypothetical protein
MVELRFRSLPYIFVLWWLFTKIHVQLYLKLQNLNGADEVA